MAISAPVMGELRLALDEILVRDVEPHRRDR